MKKDIERIVNAYLAKPDYRDLNAETEKLIRESPEAILHFLDVLHKTNVEDEWKRKQLRDRFTAYLLQLEEDAQINVTYKAVRKYQDQLHVKEIADKLCFFVAPGKLLKQILRSKEEEELKDFNRLLINELLLRGKVLTPDEKNALKSLCDFDLSWEGLELAEIEKDLPLRSYTLNGGSYAITFGLQQAEKYPYSVAACKGLKLLANKDQKINALAATVATAYISLLEVGTFDSPEQDVADLKAGIICHLNYRKTSAKSVEIAFKKMEGKDVFSYLFNMSVLGGAYESGEFGATSRTKAWKALSGLLQMDYSTSDKRAVLAELNEYDWWEFSCNNGWFINEWLDLGIIGINERKGKYAVLVISDTD